MILKERHRQILIDIFSSVGTPIEVWAFGSRVNGKAIEGSDLDLVGKTKDGQKIPVKDFSAILDKIEESRIPFMVDFFDWARLPETFHRNIKKQYEVLYP
ncbi:MAG: nucleotidyltransferase domain-containing protein [Planctomycetaceae bacterium]|jgi:predicted nucleotidyltransferase|nr:nucleotidyltransferase domain-containing protein [Planctomycetaceae bacterium]